jgi:hypothetical protein
LSERFFSGRQCKDDEPVDLALILRSQDGIRIEASFGVFG